MIPKIIHYAWFGSKIPQNVQERIDNWKKVIPDWQFKFRSSWPSCLIYDVALDLTIEAKEKITVVPNWYDGKQVLEKVNNKEFLKLRSRYRLVLLYSGNMGLMQDMKVLIHTAKLLKNNDDICFIFCGGGKK